MVRNGLKILAVIFLCLATTSCSILPANKDVDAIEIDSNDEYFAQFVNGQKNGYRIRRRTIESNRVIITKRSTEILKYGSTQITMNESSTTIETIDGKPLGFESIDNYQTKILWFFPKKHSEKIFGVANEIRGFDITKTINGKVEKSTISWPKGAVLNEGFLLLLKEKRLKEGAAFNVREFAIGELEAIDSELKVGPTKEVDLIGRKASLTEIVNTYKAQSGAIAGKSYRYIDRNFQVQKTINYIAGKKFEEIACSREFAMSKNEAAEMSTSVSCPVRLKNYNHAKSISYHLVPTGEEALEMPVTDYQMVRPHPNGSLIVTVRPVKAPSGSTFPYQGDDKVALEALKPTKYLQSDNEKIITLGRKAIGNTKDAAKAARRIERFVYGYIHKKESTLSVGLMTALEIAEGRKGDCKEHAVLTAAMCRAVGIPAQVVTGYRYRRSWAGLKHVFVPHAWTHVYVGDKWIGLDSTSITFWGLLNSFTAGHIATAIVNNENFEGMLGVVAGMGKFKINAVKQRK